MLYILNHPLITHKLTHIRRKGTNTRNFRNALNEIAGLMAYEITRDLPMHDTVVETPMATATVQELSAEVVLVPILRAGLGMVDGILGLIPDARVGHIGIARNEGTLKPEPYYEKLPERFHDAFVMVLDPMLATGGSAAAAMKLLNRFDAKSVFVNFMIELEFLHGREQLLDAADIYSMIKF